MRQKAHDSIQKYLRHATQKRFLFWILNGAYWITYWLYICLIHAWVRNFPPKILFWCSLIASTGFILCVFMRYVYTRLNIATRKLTSIFLVTVIVTTVTANLWYGFDLLLDQLMKTPDSPVAAVTFKNYLTFTFYWELLLIAWSVLYFVVKFWMAWTVQRLRTEQAALLEKRSQLQMLRYQLNPHFLFNALNSVRALIDEDERNAKVMVTELSEFLRYTLITREQVDIPLMHEIEAIRHYLAIEKKRYEDKLDVQFNIDPQAEEYPVISFIVHPLVENALKYGMRTSRMPLRIEVQANVYNGDLHVDVWNTGRWIEPKDKLKKGKLSTGTGLQNIRLRLKNAFPHRHEFSVSSENGRVHAVLKINRLIPQLSRKVAVG